MSEIRLRRGPVSWLFFWGGGPTLALLAALLIGLSLVVNGMDVASLGSLVFFALLAVPCFLVRTSVTEEALSFGLRLRPRRIPLDSVVEFTRQDDLPSVRGFPAKGIGIRLKDRPDTVELSTSIHLGERRREAWLRELNGALME